MKICIITNDFPATSADWRAGFSLAFANALVREGHSVFVFTPEKRAVKEQYETLSVRWFPWSGGDKALAKLNFFKPLDILKMLDLIRRGTREIITCVRDNHIDFCIALWAVPSGLYAYQVQKKLKLPYAVWLLGSDIWIYSKIPVVGSIIKKIIRRADLVYADGVQLGRNVTAFSGVPCAFLPTSRILPITEEIPPAAERQKKFLLFIGRLDKVKGVDLLIEALKKLPPEDHTHMQFNIFGVGQLEFFVKKKIIEFAMQDSVVFRGYASANDAARYLSLSDWLIIPSRMESIPVVLSDALQTGTPVIVSDVGDMGDFVRQYGIGLVVPPENANALSEALHRAITDKDIHTLCKKQINPARVLFDVNLTARKFVQAATRVLNKEIV